MTHVSSDNTPENETAQGSAQQSSSAMPSVPRYNYEQVERAISSRNHELYKEIVSSSTQALTDAYQCLLVASVEGGTIHEQIIRAAISRVLQASRPLYKIENIVEFEPSPEGETEEAFELRRLEGWLDTTRKQLQLLQERLGLLGHINNDGDIRLGIQALLPDFATAATQVQRLLQAEAEKVES